MRLTCTLDYRESYLFSTQRRGPSVILAAPSLEPKIAYNERLDPY
jgi:hypothetical protein